MVESASVLAFVGGGPDAVEPDRPKFGAGAVLRDAPDMANFAIECRPGCVCRCGAPRAGRAATAVPAIASAIGGGSAVATIGGSMVGADRCSLHT